MRSFRGKLHIPVIIAVTICLLVVLDFLLYPCTFMRSDIHMVTTESFDDLYLGTSHGKINIDPAAENNSTGPGRTKQPFMSRETEKVDVVVLDTDRKMPG